MGSFGFSRIFSQVPPIWLRPHWGPTGTENFESPPHQKFREKTLTPSFGLFHVKRTLLFSQRVKIQLLPIHSKHMVLWPSGCTKLSSKILERGIIVNILKSSLKFSMEKCTASGEDILFNNVNLATLKLWYASMKEWMVIWISFYYI